VPCEELADGKQPWLRRKRGPDPVQPRDGAPRGAHPSPRVPAPQGVDWI